MHTFPVTLDTHPALSKAPEYKAKLPYPQRLQRPLTLPSDTIPTPREECKAIVAEGSEQTETPEEAKSIKEVHPYRAFIESLILSGKETLKEDGTVVFTKEAESKERPLSAALIKSLPPEKKALKGDEIEVLTEEYSALIQNKLPRKMSNLGSFHILCTIGKITFDKALCDLGLSITLMPLFVMKKLGIQEAQAIRITLQIADKSLKKAYGLEENVLDKVGELFLPKASVILDKEEETDESIIPKRPFLATNGGTRIDVERGKVARRLHEDYMVFKVFKPPLPPDKGGDFWVKLANFGKALFRDKERIADAVKS
nr:uncharacterized protein LOC112748969 [Arachis hypogaea]